MKQDSHRILLTAVPPLLLLFMLYMIKLLETGTGWHFNHLGIYPMQARGLWGILCHPLLHADFKHLLANTVPLFVLSWCLFYFYRHIAYYIYIALWLGCGLLTFFLGQPGWHIGASGIIYGLAFFLFFSGILRKHIPLLAVSLLVVFLYGSIIWNMFPQFAKATTSWEGHLAGAITGTLCAVLFKNYGPQKPNSFADEDQETEEKDNEKNDEKSMPKICMLSPEHDKAQAINDIPMAENKTRNNSTEIKQKISQDRQHNDT